MSKSIQQLEEWLRELEGERPEFKEAKRKLSFGKLAEYCAALATRAVGRWSSG